jgi:hypothetical protein
VLNGFTPNTITTVNVPARSGEDSRVGLWNRQRGRNAGMHLRRRTCFDPRARVAGATSVSVASSRISPAQIHQLGSLTKGSLSDRFPGVWFHTRNTFLVYALTIFPLRYRLTAVRLSIAQQRASGNLSFRLVRSIGFA